MHTCVHSCPCTPIHSHIYTSAHSNSYLPTWFVFTLTSSHSCSPLNAQTLSYSYVHSILHPTLQILHISAFAPTLAHSDNHDYDHASLGTSTLTHAHLCPYAHTHMYSCPHLCTCLYLLTHFVSHSLSRSCRLLHTLAQSHSHTHTQTLLLMFTLTHINFCMDAHSHNLFYLTDSCDHSCTLACHTPTHSLTCKPILTFFHILVAMATYALSHLSTALLSYLYSSTVRLLLGFEFQLYYWRVCEL